MSPASNVDDGVGGGAGRPDGPLRIINGSRPARRGCLYAFDPMLFAMLATRATALMRLGQIDQAAEWAVRSIARPNAHQHIRGVAALWLELAGRHDEALGVLMSLHREHPGYNVVDLLQAFHFAADGERLIRRAAAGIGLA